jgi:hypothetical protein
MAGLFTVYRGSVSVRVSFGPYVYLAQKMASCIQEH